MTKLGVQARGMRHVERERLRDRLDGSLEARLVLVTAPAGFGRSTLLADWLDRSALRHAWVSLDVRDDDVVRFARYLAATVGRLAGRHEALSAPDARRAARSAGSSSGGAPGRTAAIGNAGGRPWPSAVPFSRTPMLAIVND